MWQRRGVTLVLVAVLSSSLAACSEADGAPGSRAGRLVVPSATAPAFATSMPADAVSVVPGTTAAQLALGTSRALFRRAPIVAVAGESDPAAQARAASFAVALGSPLLLSPPSQPPPVTPPPEASQQGPPPAIETSGRPGPDDRELTRELQRLDAITVLTVGAAATRWAAAMGVTGSVEAPRGRIDDAVLALTLTPTVAAEPLTDLVVLAGADPASDAAAATAVAAGADVQVIGERDPRESSEAIAAISARDDVAVMALGDEFGPPDRFAARVAVAATGVELPGGGQVLFPGRRLVSLYGSPGIASLGSLGEQDVDAAVTRAREVADSYGAVSGEQVVPAFEIITTVASGAAGDDGDYSYDVDRAQLERWVDAAREADVYVVLDLQPGRSDFLSQAQRYEQLLLQPHVGLALDPEWRLEPDQVHLRQIGAVSAAEVNSVVTWLGDLVAENDLPQKLLLLHQFRNSMITDRDQVDTSRDELAVLVHADGYGTPGQKLDTWRNLRGDGAEEFWWGWKNFYDEDTPTMTPTQTMAVDPAPVFVSYQ